MLKFEYTAKFFLYILWNLKVDVFKMVCDFFFFFGHHLIQFGIVWNTVH